MSSKTKEDDKKQKTLRDKKTKGKNPLAALTEVLEISSKQLRNKWCEQLLYKLYIIHNEFKNTEFNICIENLNIDENNNLVLINVYGTQNSNFSVQSNTKTKQDIKFIAPELIENNEKTKAGDIWAAGVCIFYIINSSFPWEAANKSDKSFCEWADKGIFPKSIDSSYIKPLKKMLCVDSDLRPNIKDVIKLTLHAGTDKKVIGK